MRSAWSPAPPNWMTGLPTGGLRRGKQFVFPCRCGYRLFERGSLDKTKSAVRATADFAEQKKKKEAEASFFVAQTKETGSLYGGDSPINLFDRLHDS